MTKKKATVVYSDDLANIDPSTLPVIDIANDANDDWIKKANPESARKEIEILEALEKKFKEEAAERAAKEAAGKKGGGQ